jgi:hypothetical protein
VKKESIVYAFKNHKILIKHHARCCVRHLDENGYIKIDQFPFILTHEGQKIDKITTQLKDTEFLWIKSGIFDEFKNMASLSEDTCYKITRWTKEQFIRFSKYISSINDSGGRTLEQLIALYRYWLR